MNPTFDTMMKHSLSSLYSSQGNKEWIMIWLWHIHLHANTVKYTVVIPKLFILVEFNVEPVASAETVNCHCLMLHCTSRNTYRRTRVTLQLSHLHLPPANRHQPLRSSRTCRITRLLWQHKQTQGWSCCNGKHLEAIWVSSVPQSRTL